MPANPLAIGLCLALTLCACSGKSDQDSSQDTSGADAASQDNSVTAPPLRVDSRFRPADEGAAYDGAGADEAAFADKVDHSLRVSQLAQPGSHVNANVEVRCEIETRLSSAQVIASCYDRPADSHEFVVEGVPKLDPHDRFHIYGHVEPGFHFNAAGTVYPAIDTDYLLP